jgi:hypothetical protein
MSDCGKVGSYSPPNYPKVQEPGQTESTEVFSVPASDALSLKIIEQNRSKILYKDVVDPHTGSFSTRHNGLA